jgi:uncharacterized protein
MKKIIILITFFISIQIFAQPKMPQLHQYATDLTGSLTQTELTNLNSKLRNFDAETTTQIVFLMINSLNGYPMSMYTNELAEKSKIGTKKNDNGILFFVALKDKKMRIEVGYGLEGALTDALSSSILRNVVRPFFIKGEYFKGVSAGINSIIAATKGQYVRTQQQQQENDDRGGLGFWVYLILFLLMSIFSRFGRRGGFIYLGGFGGGFGGSGGGGGSFGGFSGGGGGFGGGGASGSW